MAQSIRVNNAVGTGDGSWRLTKNAFQNPKSVVQTILNRQLGLPYCSSKGDISELVIARQLLNSRAVSEEKGKPVKAAKIGLIPEKIAQTLDKRVRAPSWIQIDVPDNLEVTIAENRLWAQRNIGGNTTSEEFYLVEPYPDPGLNCIKKRLHSSATGNLIEPYVIASRRSSSGKSSTYFLILAEPGVLWAFDLVRNEITDQLNLPINISQQNLVEYTGMSIMENENGNKIYIYGMNKTLTKVIIVLSFPPWNESRIIHVEIPFLINIDDGVCFLRQKHVLHITTWPLLMQKVTKTDSPRFPTDQVDYGLPNIKFEGKLTELPEILSTVNSQPENYGVIKMSVPMFYRAVSSGINFFEFQNDEYPVHQFWSGTIDDDDPIEVYPFPDGTSKALLYTHFSGQSHVVEFKTEWNDDENRKVPKATILDVFNYWEKSRIAAQASIAATNGERRPKRACANNRAIDGCFRKISILGITYCSLMDYIAVLTADDEEFQVVIYDPVRFNVIKALPPVLAWPGVKGNVNKKREYIKGVQFSFAPELIFVGFLYSAICKPEREVFFVRLLSEQY